MVQKRFGGHLIGHIFTDGAMKARWWWIESQRAGWGAAMMNGRRLISGIFGTLPGPCQTVPRAELHAIVEVLRVTIRPAWIHTDHFNILTAIAKGKAHTTSPGHPNADLWNTFWGIIEDLGDGMPTLDFLGSRGTSLRTAWKGWQ